MATIFDPPRREEFSRKWVTIGRDSAVITIENLTFMRYRRLDRRTVTIETSIPSQVEWIPNDGGGELSESFFYHDERAFEPEIEPEIRARPISCISN